MHMSRQISCSLEAMVNKPCLCHTNTEYRRQACRERRVTNLTHEQGPCRNTASSLTPESPQQAFRTLSKKLGKLSCIIGFSKWRHSNRRRGAKILVAAILAPLTILFDLALTFFSFDSSVKNQISVPYKALIMCNNNEMCINRQNHVSNYALYKTAATRPLSKQLAPRQFTQQDNG